MATWVNWLNECSAQWLIPEYAQRYLISEEYHRAEAYDPYSVDDGYEDEEEEVVVAEWNWGKKIVMVSNPWERGVEESYDFDVTKLDELFDFLLEKG